MNRQVTLLVVGVVLVVAAGCSVSDSAGEETVAGIISEVSGDLTSVTSFVVLSDDGTSHKFTPRAGLLFYGGPLTHLRDHVVTGQRIVVSYERDSAGALIAVAIEHEDGDSDHETHDNE